MTRKVENETVSKRRRKPGRLWWLWTFAIGICSPRKGQRRVDATLKEAAEESARDKWRIAELQQQNAQLVSDKELLMDEKSELVARSKDFRARLDMADGITEMNKVKIAADKVASTMPLRAVTRWGTTDPGVINAQPGKHTTNDSDQSSKAC